MRENKRSKHELPWGQELTLLCLQFDWRCQKCERRVKLPTRGCKGKLDKSHATRQHIVPQCRGGGGGSNVVLWCYGCNQQDGHKVAQVMVAERDKKKADGADGREAREREAKAKGSGFAKFRRDALKRNGLEL